ncbi:alanine racemase [Noviherbaspirillum cavernae]|uniref:Alanine racemase n=1 Tax=Noviherbaspirillum cavernae TaxID=2320862 RepID=A0A418WVV0_9BURK|nr:alanine racemase [Noviherbaspirillum cavernae]RJF96820.1 alanine racemase [Noviherbaspirillum cavernae]
MNADMQRAGAILTIDLDAVRDNHRLLRARTGGAVCAAVMKADAYGLGAQQVAPVLANDGCRHFFVAHLDEGIRLRAVLPPDAEVFVLHGPPVGAEREFVAHNLIPVLNSLQQTTAWSALARQMNARLPALLQVDTGMSRMGMPDEEIDVLLPDAEILAPLELRYLMSHLACAEVQDHPMNAAQLRKFHAIRARFPAMPACLANSSGIFLGPDYHFDLVRPGAALYGIAPVAGMANPMRSVVRLQGKIIQTRTIRQGDYVGYGISYSATGTRDIATVAVGYADGWLRAMSNRGAGFIDGVRVPFVGTVSMDSITLDVTGIDKAKLAAGALVDLICPEHPVDAVAALAGSIGYEILTSLGRRYHREYLAPQDDLPQAASNRTALRAA